MRKSALTESLQGLTRQIMEEQKKAAAANKERAVAAAVEAADAAAAAGGKFLVARLEVGLDTKAVQVGGRQDGGWVLRGVVPFLFLPEMLKSQACCSSAFPAQLRYLPASCPCISPFLLPS